MGPKDNIKNTELGNDLEDWPRRVIAYERRKR